MPLSQNPSEEAFRSNIKEMHKAGHPIKQCIAAAISMLAKHPINKLPKKLRKLVEKHNKKHAK
jgi:hypothetical protein